MNNQQLRAELENIKIFQDLVEVMRATAGAAFPKLIKKLGSFRVYNNSIIESMQQAIDQIEKWGLSENELSELLKDDQQHIILNILKQKGVDGLHTLVKKATTTPKKILIVGIGANRGFCGRFNKDLVSYLKEESSKFRNEGIVADYIIIGKKIQAGISIFAPVPPANKFSFPDGLWKSQSKEIRELLNIIITQYIEKQYDEVRIIYNRFPNEKSTKIELVNEHFLPLVPNQPSEKLKQPDPLGRETILEPSSAKVLVTLLPHYFEIAFTEILIESETSENFTRMNAMNQASDSIKEEIEKILKLIRKNRQKRITNQLIELISSGMAIDKDV